MTRQVLNNNEAFGIQRGKINSNFLSLFSDMLDAGDVLLQTNTNPYSPTNPYNPATKQYADSIASSWASTYDPGGEAVDVFNRANHVGNMAANYVTQSPDYRFVSNTQIASWNNKEDTIGAKGTAFNKNFGTTDSTVATGDHTHNKGDVGLGNVDNTADADKVISNLTQTALDLKATQATTYTKDQADDLLDLKADIVTTYTKTENDVAIALKRALTNNDFGDTVDYTRFEADGSLVMNGAATTWEDINLDPTNLSGKGIAPTLTDIASTGLSGAGFKGNETNEVIGCFEYPHKAKLGAFIDFHCHVLPTTTAGGNIRLGVEYVISRESGAISTSTTIEVTAALGTVAWKKQTVDFGLVNAPTELGAQIHFRFYRLGSDALDTNNATIIVQTIGIHYEADQLGSREETVK